ncbi:Trm112 family protein [Rhizobium sp. DBTS2]|uniref:UPF0434 protein HV823_01200 n=1 Tax=Mycoplana rhizolycopersici TaxID=2746702 RepID=A0ABX2Q819_9HYPH|nr:Trm112 family protein [Rhizobium rhizolycopersici]
MSTRGCNRSATVENKTNSVDPKLLELLVCPLTKGRLSWHADTGELVSERAKLAYPVRDGIPIMLISEARELKD